jgi:hypothetical protein
MRKKRDKNGSGLHAAILRAARLGRGLRLSSAETKVLAAQPFVVFRFDFKLNDDFKLNEIMRRRRGNRLCATRTVARKTTGQPIYIGAIILRTRQMPSGTDGSPGNLHHFNTSTQLKLSSRL